MIGHLPSNFLLPHLRKRQHLHHGLGAHFDITPVEEALGVVTLKGSENEARLHESLDQRSFDAGTQQLRRMLQTICTTSVQVYSLERLDV